MKEKKEMQIVVTADDSKAKTSLQKLADYLKNNFESGAKTAEYDIDTVKSEIKLSKLEDKIKTMKDLLKNGNLNEGEFNSWAEDIAKAEVEADKLRQTLSNTDKEVDSTSKSINNLGTKVANSLETASKKTRKFVLSLFSVRTAWAVISRASSTYLSENESTTNKVAAAWSYLGNILGPVIEKIVSWLQYGIAYVNVFVKALTGVDFLAKSIQKTVAKTNKELKKTVSSMDEIVNLDLDNGANSGVGAANALQDIADLELNPKIVEFMEKLGEATRVVWDWAKKAWNFLEEHFGTTGAGLIVGGLALLIGGAGSGLMGVATLLKTISTIGTIAIGVDLLYGALTGRDLIQDLKDIKQGYLDLKSINETLTNTIKKNNDEAKTFASNWDNAMDTSSAEDFSNAVDYISNRIDGSNTTISGFNESLEENEKNAKNIANAFSTVPGIIMATESPIQRLIWNILGTKTAEALLGDTIRSNNEDIEIETDTMNTYASSLEKTKEKLKEQISKTKEGTDEYKVYNDALQKVNSKLNELNGKKVKSTAEVEIKDNSDSWWYKLSNKMNNWLGGFNTKITNLFNGKGFTYATGGFPEEGQMFIANERGPELVGNIGGSTAVVNNQQIVESVSQGVASAVAGVLTNQKSTSQSAQYLYINGSEFAKAVYDDMETERHRRNTNTSIRRA